MTEARDSVIDIELRSQLPDTVLAMGEERPRLTWRIGSDRADIRQLAYEIEVAATPDFAELTATTGIAASQERVAVAAPGEPLRSRDVRHYRVRVETNHGRSDWSQPLWIEAGLLRPEDWEASAITLPDDPGRRSPAPAPCLRREFHLDDPPRRARLYVTSLGVHEVRINGRRVGVDLLSPGWTSYHHRLIADTHDVTGLLASGANAIAAVLGDGWYRGRLGWEPGKDRCRYGEELGLILQLEIETESGRAVIVSDGAWRASTAEIRTADLYDGVSVDLRRRQEGWDRPGFDDASWPSAAVITFDPRVLEPRMSPPVRAVEVRPMARVGTTSETILDSGQNLAGFVRLRVQGRAGDRVTVRHAEVLESDGALHTRSLRSAKAMDEYVLADDGETLLEPPFTFHGFRYAEVVTDARLLGAEAVAISSDLAPRGSFACSDPRLDQLHQNVSWSLRSNFVSIPTDCPQRDERLGWTGDAQVFARAACTLTHAEAFWRSWLRDLEKDQDDELGVSSVVPDVVIGGVARYGRAGWGDAATIVPWAVYESYGDVTILRDQLGSMRRWVDSLVTRQQSDGLLTPSWQFGDWLDPDAPSDRPWEAKADPDFIANAYFAHSARLLADAAVVLDEPGIERIYRPLAERVAAATWAQWGADARTSQTGCAIALELDIVPDAERTAIVEALAGLVDASGGRVATGFLGTPLVLPALARAGQFDQAYRLLLCDEPPSWLYQVEQGATTVWERWDAIRPDGSIHPGTLAPVPGTGTDEEGHMLSFNHYAYGAVVDWLYRHVAGIATDRSGPGYAVTRFAPRPADRVRWAKASVESAVGEVTIGWRLEPGRFVADILLPVGTRGRFVPPCSTASEVTADGVSCPTSEDVLLEAGKHRITVTAPVIASSVPSPSCREVR